MRVLLATLIELPSLLKERTDRAEPNEARACAEIEAPNRVNDRIDMLDPALKKFITEVEEPMRTTPIREKPLCSFANERNDKLLAISKAQ
jgi:hypothetical protein